MRNRLTPDRRSQASDSRMSIPLAIIAISLMVVGALSETMVRHAIQVVPLVVVAILAIRGWHLATAAGVGLLLFWFVIMLLIWAFLFDIATIVSGHYTTGEVVLTVLIALTALSGMVLVVGGRRSVAKTRVKLFVFVVAMGLQALVVQFSYSRLLP